MPTRFDLEWDDCIGHFATNVGEDLLWGEQWIGSYLKKAKESGKTDDKELQKIKEYIEAVLTDEVIPEVKEYGDRGTRKSLDRLERLYKHLFHTLPDNGKQQKNILPTDRINPVKRKPRKKRETPSMIALKMREEGKDWHEEIGPECFGKDWYTWPESKRGTNIKRLQSSMYSLRRRNRKRQP